MPDVIVGSPDDPDKTRELANQVDVLTFDHELVDPEALASLEADGHVVWPSSATMALAQNKRRQRSVTFKEIRLSPKIGVGDFDTKVNRAIEFLEEGDRIKVTDAEFKFVALNDNGSPRPVVAQPN